MGRYPLDKLVTAQGDKTHDVDHVAVGLTIRWQGGDMGTMGAGQEKGSPMRARPWHHSTQSVGAV